MNIDTLLSPVSSQHPCGENLEYDSRFQAMEQAAEGKSERQFGDTVIPEEPADWQKVENIALELLKSTKDLRVMLVLTQAWTHLRGLQGYADGLQLIKQAMLFYWQPLWPGLEQEGEPDPFYRINALAALGDHAALTAAVRQSYLLRHQSEAITLRDAQALLEGSKSEVASYPGGKSRLTQSLATGEHPGVNAIVSISECLQTICDIITEHLGAAAVPAVSQLMRSIRLIMQFCRAEEPASPAEAVVNDVAEPQTTNANLSLSRSDIDWRNIQIDSREDAKQILEQAKHYFLRHEPGHPAGPLIDRVQRLMDLDFLQIIRELAPDSIQQIENIIGQSD